jgi:transmembrane sensor
VSWEAAPAKRVKRTFVARHWSMAAAVATVICATSLWLWWDAGRATMYTTQVGEQRAVTLSDGSLMQLNARSRIAVRFTAAGRDIDLLEGQALFRVKKDAARPFVVHSGAAQVRAVGTEFDVYRKKTGTVVTVVEGRVAVSDSLVAKQTPALLSAGEQVTVAPKLASRPRKADVAAVTAWTQRRLVFHASSLPDVAEEFNRYNAQPRIIVDPVLADFKISGVYASTDPELFLRFLRTQRGIAVRASAAEIVVTAK